MFPGLPMPFIHHLLVSCSYLQKAGMKGHSWNVTSSLSYREEGHQRLAEI